MCANSGIHNKEYIMITVMFKHPNEKKPFAVLYAADKKSAMAIANSVNVPGSNVQAHVED